MKKIIVWIITTSLFMILLTGCNIAVGTDNIDDPLLSDSEIEEYSEDYLSLINENDKNSDEPVKRVGVAMPTRTSERWIDDGMNMKAKLETLGYEVDLQYADDDIDLQISQIESMIRNDVNCLVIASIDSTRLTDVLARAKNKGISIIAYDRLLMDTNAVSYYASFDNKAVGTLIGQYIEDNMNLKEAKRDNKSYTIEFFMGSPDDNNAVFLYNGVMEVLKPYLENGVLVCRSGETSFEETCILRWSEETARVRCRKLVNAFYADDNLDIACSAFDGFVYGILTAYDELGITYDKLPMITGQDAEKPAVRNITDGKQSMTIYKDTRILASKCVTMVQAMLEGMEPEINDTTQYDNNMRIVPSYLCDPVVIDINNYEDILIGGGYYTKEQLFK